MRKKAQENLTILLTLLDNQNLFPEIPAGPWNDLLSLQSNINHKTDFEIVRIVHAIFFKPTQAGTIYQKKISENGKNILNLDHREKYEKFLEILGWFKETLLKEEEKQEKEIERKKAIAAAATPPSSASTSPQTCFLLPPPVRTQPPPNTHNPESQSLICHRKT